MMRIKRRIVKVKRNLLKRIEEMIFKFNRFYPAGIKKGNITNVSGGNIIIKNEMIRIGVFKKQFFFLQAMIKVIRAINHPSMQLVRIKFQNTLKGAGLAVALLNSLKINTVLNDFVISIEIGMINRKRDSKKRIKTRMSNCFSFIQNSPDKGLFVR